jgi:hypothetical protein
MMKKFRREDTMVVVPTTKQTLKLKRFRKNPSPYLSRKTLINIMITLETNR